MSYQNKHLSFLAYANGFTLWHYRTDETNHGDLGYFDEAYDTVKVGDLIIVVQEVDKEADSTIYLVKKNKDRRVAHSPISV